MKGFRQCREDRRSRTDHDKTMARSAGSPTRLDDTDTFGLVAALNGLVLDSLPPLECRSNKPLPPLPAKPHNGEVGQQLDAASLPPYLAHLAGPSQATHLHSSVSFPQPQHHHEDRFASAGHDDRLRAAGFPLPRPPTLASTLHTGESLPGQRTGNEHPSALRPAQIHLGQSSKPSYPWELVPQAKPQPRPHPQQPSTGLSATPNRPSRQKLQEDQASIGYSESFGEASRISTPPRTKLNSSLTNHSHASWSPNGSQTDAACPPAKGQCWGIKKDGSRCTRRVGSAKANVKSTFSPSRSMRESSAPARMTKATSAATPLVVSDSDDEDIPATFSSALPSARKRGSSASTKAAGAGSIRAFGDEMDEAYCYQHVAEVNKTAGLYHQHISGVRRFIPFGDWFRTVDLDAHTQAVLRSRMSQPLSEKDRAEPGYLYIYELRDRSTATHLCLKVGRTVNVFRRLGEWRYKCQSNDPLLRAFFPSDGRQGLISGMHAATVPGVFLSHRWEYLVHTELSGIGQRVDEDCSCGTHHREIFMIPRWLGSRDESRQHQQNGFDTAQAVIEKWMRFVQALV